MADRETPCFVLEEQKLRQNLSLLKQIERETDIHILHTLKSFHQEEGTEIIASQLSGFSISNLTEYQSIAHLPNQQIHSYAPVLFPNEIERLASISDTLSFNSLSQWESLVEQVTDHTSVGLRINPALPLKQPDYCNPTLSTGRLGVPSHTFLNHYHHDENFASQVEGLHFHLFCNQGFDALEKLLSYLTTHYHPILPKLRWLNLGGGQNLTHRDYPIEKLITALKQFSQRYPNLTLYLEPGSSVLHNCGYFETTIVDIIETDEANIALLDTSIETHLLDIAITKQRPTVRNASQKGRYKYELTGISCIAGDSLGEYRFDTPLQIGERIVLENMLGYTLVKQTEFNGIGRAKFYLV